MTPNSLKKAMRKIVSDMHHKLNNKQRHAKVDSSSSSSSKSSTRTFTPSVELHDNIANLSSNNPLKRITNTYTKRLTSANTYQSKAGNQVSYSPYHSNLNIMKSPQQTLDTYHMTPEYHLEGEHANTVSHSSSSSPSASDSSESSQTLLKPKIRGAYLA